MAIHPELEQIYTKDREERIAMHTKKMKKYVSKAQKDEFKE